MNALTETLQTVALVTLGIMVLVTGKGCYQLELDSRVKLAQIKCEARQ